MAVEDKKDMNEHNIRLTASEMGFLWTQFENDTLAICVLKYFANKCEDKEILPVVEFALDLSQKHIQIITEIFANEKIPIPAGFSDEDVNVNAPKLFTDTFMLLYLQSMGTIGMTAASIAISCSSREDISKLFQEILIEAKDLHDMARKTALAKGIYIRPPYISNPDKVQFITKQRFLFDFVGKSKRPLTAIEITHLFINVQTNSMGKALMMAFAQVCKGEDVKQFFTEGKNIANKHIKKFSSTLTNGDIPAPMSWDSHVLDSTVAPFSDKLMMFHTTGMIAVGIGNYGAAAGTCERMDLSALYTRLSAEIALFAEDGANIMIKHGWLEEPPQADDRQALVNQPK
ncbi:DUF3231 family protein [Neobacillus mesonae]|uniref:DUF3231 family protein n=1 Tax=Neobacillus mesonae TaxID=1193713 RepID=UPI00203F4EA8|nr:DUF3231 family protein [Neobacillus mesonae]MCM3571401.1 DUF3231 family protein [Neobacillus mesonae]